MAIQSASDRASLNTSIWSSGKVEPPAAWDSPDHPVSPALAVVFSNTPSRNNLKLLPSYLMQNFLAVLLALIGYNVPAFIALYKMRYPSFLTRNSILEGEFDKYKFPTLVSLPCHSFKSKNQVNGVPVTRLVIFNDVKASSPRVTLPPEWFGM